MGAVIEYLQSIPVKTPIEVPIITTLSPARVYPSTTSFTVPVIEMLCADIPDESISNTNAIS